MTNLTEQLLFVEIGSKLSSVKTKAAHLYCMPMYEFKSAYDELMECIGDVEKAFLAFSDLKRLSGLE